MEKSRNVTDRDGRGGRGGRGGILHRPPSLLCSSLLLCLFVQSRQRQRQKMRKGVLRRRGPVEATWEGDGSPLKCTLIAAKQKKKIKKETGGKKTRWENNSGLPLCQEVLAKWQKLVFSLHLSLPHLICCCCCFSSSPPPSSLVSFFNLFRIECSCSNREKRTTGPTTVARRR